MFSYLSVVAMWFYDDTKDTAEQLKQLKPAIIFTEKSERKCYFNEYHFNTIVAKKVISKPHNWRNKFYCSGT